MQRPGTQHEGTYTCITRNALMEENSATIFVDFQGLSLWMMLCVLTLIQWLN